MTSVTLSGQHVVFLEHIEVVTGCLVEGDCAKDAVVHTSRWQRNVDMGRCKHSTVQSNVDMRLCKHSTVQSNGDKIKPKAALFNNFPPALFYFTSYLFILFYLTS